MDDLMPQQDGEWELIAHGRLIKTFETEVAGRLFLDQFRPDGYFKGAILAPREDVESV
ncbi:hypothetical protein [Paenibacillus filicis]|uniref:hypothetical protein n=1 Tax=Paenibacillus filicis TaxID=669464 RepID=UPI0031197F37